MDFDALIATCEDRLDKDEELLADAREQLHEVDQLITQLERAHPTVGAGEAEELQTALDNARKQRAQTEALIEELEARRAETQARYDQLQHLLSHNSESGPESSQQHQGE